MLVFKCLVSHACFSAHAARAEFLVAPAAHSYLDGGSCMGLGGQLAPCEHAARMRLDAPRCAARALEGALRRMPTPCSLQHRGGTALPQQLGAHRMAPPGRLQRCGSPPHGLVPEGAPTRDVEDVRACLPLLSRHCRLPGSKGTIALGKPCPWAVPWGPVSGWCQAAWRLGCRCRSVLLTPRQSRCRGVPCSLRVQPCRRGRNKQPEQQHFSSGLPRTASCRYASHTPVGRLPAAHRRLDAYRSVLHGCHALPRGMATPGRLHAHRRSLLGTRLLQQAHPARQWVHLMSSDEGRGDGSRQETCSLGTG